MSNTSLRYMPPGYSKLKGDIMTAIVLFEDDRRLDQETVIDEWWLKFFELRERLASNISLLPDVSTELRRASSYTNIVVKYCNHRGQIALDAVKESVEQLKAFFQWVDNNDMLIVR